VGLSRLSTEYLSFYFIYFRSQHKMLTQLYEIEGTKSRACESAIVLKKATARGALDCVCPVDGECKHWHALKRTNYTKNRALIDHKGEIIKSKHHKKRPSWATRALFVEVIKIWRQMKWKICFGEKF